MGFIFKYNSKCVMVNVSNKSGITSCINIAGSQWLKNPLALKTEAKKNIGLNFYEFYSIFPPQVPLKIDIKIAIVREPISRVKSVYTDRVIKKKKYTPEDLSFDYFFRNFKEIRSISEDICKHSHPQSLHLGSDANFYDYIFKTNELHSKFKDLIEEISGYQIPPKPAFNKSSQEDFALTVEQEAYFQEYYKQDYENYGDYF